MSVIGRSGGALLFIVALALAPARAADSRPVVGLGARREAILEAYGWPSGQSITGNREVLTYPQGQVFLTDGVVTRMEFSTSVAWPKPKPRPGSPKGKSAPSAAKAPELDPWQTSFAEARREARARSAQILALFTGSDWSPPCKRFLAEVARAPGFLHEVEGEFVLLRLDLPTHTPQAPELRVQNTTLRERYGVTTYPALRLLSAEGLELARVDLEKSRSEATYVDQVLAAIAEAKPKPSVLMTWQDEEPDKVARRGSGLPTVWWARIERAWPAAAALAVVVVVVWWRRGRRRPAVTAAPVLRPTNGLPTPAEIAGWPLVQLSGVVAALLEFEGTKVMPRAESTGASLALIRPPEARPFALVGLHVAADGLAGAKAIRELFATAVAEGVAEAWFVAPGGFVPEARQFASDHGLVLIGGEELLLRLKALPPLALVRVLGARAS